MIVKQHQLNSRQGTEHNSKYVYKSERGANDLINEHR